jgi:hypothetical protein
MTVRRKAREPNIDECANSARLHNQKRHQTLLYLVVAALAADALLEAEESFLQGIFIHLLLGTGPRSFDEDSFVRFGCDLVCNKTKR